jgi:hypothetical protein
MREINVFLSSFEHLQLGHAQSRLSNDFLTLDIKSINPMRMTSRTLPAMVFITFLLTIYLSANWSH